MWSHSHSWESSDIEGSSPGRSSFSPSLWYYLHTDYNAHSCQSVLMQTVAAFDMRLNYMVPLVGNGLNRAGIWSEWRCSFLLVCLQNCVRSQIRSQNMSSVQPSSIAQCLLKEGRREKPQFTHTLVSISHSLTWSPQGTNRKDNCGPRHVAPGITFWNWNEFDEDKDSMNDWTEVGVSWCPRCRMRHFPQDGFIQAHPAQPLLGGLLSPPTFTSPASHSPIPT